MKQKTTSVLGFLIAAAITFSLAHQARANVYATNIKVNGNVTNTVNTSQGSSVTISYILNEAATAGVAINVLSGSTVVRTISIASGEGANKGSNTVIWDGKATGGANVAIGTYSVSITAAATGYADWTQISDDTAPSSYCVGPRSIAVNKNTNSPYYGRIFIGNVFNNGTNWGDVPGIYKVNADGSYSDDGAGRYGTAGYPFTGAGYYDGVDNPINMKVMEDDRVYWNNWFGFGEVVAADMLLTTNQIVLTEANYTGNPYYNAGANWKNFFVTDVLTDHARIYMASPAFPSAGVWYWPLTNGVVDANDPNASVGYQAISTGGSLSLRCDGMAIDANTNVYAIQNRSNAGDPAVRAVAWTNWDGVTTLFDGAAWVVGGADDTFRNIYTMALDSFQNPKYIAVSMSSLTSGGIRILNVTNGSTVVANLSSASTYHGVNWDNVGNLYGGSSTAARWRVFSPPGANQATTAALATLQVTAAVTPIHIGTISVSGGNVTINFTSDTSDTAGSFTLQQSLTVNGTYGNVSAVITQTGPGAFQAVVATSGGSSFYKIKK